MRYDHSLWAHIGLGSLAMSLFWATLLSAKGSQLHRRTGRSFFLAMLATVLTVPAVVLLRPVPFDLGWVVSLVYLSVCVGTVVTVAWTAIRWKGQPERFRGLHFRLLGPLVAVLGAVVLVAGLVKGDPVAAVLSWVGLSYGTAMIYFAWSRAALHRQWWLAWHVNAVLGLFTAVHGTLGFVMWRALVAPEATRAHAAAWHVGVLVVALLIRAVIGRKRGLPWGLFFVRQAHPPLQEPRRAGVGNQGAARTKAHPARNHRRPMTPSHLKVRFGVAESGRQWTTQRSLWRRSALTPGPAWELSFAEAVARHRSDESGRKGVPTDHHCKRVWPSGGMRKPRIGAADPKLPPWGTDCLL